MVERRSLRAPRLRARSVTPGYELCRLENCERNLPENWTCRSPGRRGDFRNDQASSSSRDRDLDRARMPAAIRGRMSVAAPGRPLYLYAPGPREAGREDRETVHVDRVAGGHARRCRGVRQDLLRGLQVGQLGARLPARLRVGGGGDRADDDAAVPPRPPFSRRRDRWPHRRQQLHGRACADLRHRPDHG